MGLYFANTRNKEDNADLKHGIYVDDTTTCATMHKK